MKPLAVVASLFLPALLAVPSAATAAEEEHAFVGSKNCKKCHIKEFRSWEETRMAQAFETLKPGVAVEAKVKHGLDPQEDFTSNAECVSCHVTGWGAESGFQSEAQTPELAGVGCEACHGAGGTYLGEGYMTLDNKEYKRADLEAVGLVSFPGEAQCVACHNEKVPIEGYTFDFEAAKNQGTHENFPLKFSHD